jgi:hypothetical protein
MGAIWRSAPNEEAVLFDLIAMAWKEERAGVCLFMTIGTVKGFIIKVDLGGGPRRRGMSVDGGKLYQGKVSAFSINSLRSKSPPAVETCNTRYGVCV